MAAKNTVRRSVSLPAKLAHKVSEMAKRHRTSASKILLDLIEKGMDSQDMERRHFFALADALVASKDPAEQRRLKAELARLTFGE